MGKCCQICVVESRGEVEDQGSGDFLSERKFDHEYLFRGAMWADNYWSFSDDKEKLVYGK